MFAPRITVSLLLIVGLVTWACWAPVRAADKPVENKSDKPAEKNADKPPADGDEKAEDPYKLPEGGVKELLEFIKQMQARRLTIKSRDEFIEFRNKARPAMKAAAEKMQQIATDEDKKLEGYDSAMGLLLAFRAEEIATGSPQDVKKLLADIKAALAAEHPDSQVNLAATQLGVGLEYNPRSELKAMAPEVYADLGATLARSKDPQVAKTGVKMEGAARRLNLLGKPLDLKGTQMDGSPFDWAKYRGKVVLVDFWATWCGPCKAELPNVKKNYELYHDRGFEVVGVSLDQDREKLEDFLKEEGNPWITLHDGGWDDNATATYYGIMGIPAVILVDEEGKVLSTRARGLELGKLLAARLGPATPGKTEKTDDADK